MIDEKLSINLPANILTEYDRVAKAKYMKRAAYIRSVLIDVAQKHACEVPDTAGAKPTRPVGRPSTPKPVKPVTVPPPPENPLDCDKTHVVHVFRRDPMKPTLPSVITEKHIAYRDIMQGTEAGELDTLEELAARFGIDRHKAEELVPYQESYWRWQDRYEQWEQQWGEAWRQMHESAAFEEDDI